MEKSTRQTIEELRRQKEYASVELRKMSFTGLTVEAIWSRKAAIRSLRGLLMEQDILDNEILRHEERLSDKREDHEKLKALTPFNPARPFKTASVVLMVFVIVSLAVAIPIGHTVAGLILSVLLAFVAAGMFVAYKKVKHRVDIFRYEQEKKKASIEEEVASIEEKIARLINQKADLDTEIMRHAAVLEIEGEVKNKELDVHEMQIEGVLKLLDKQSRQKEEIERIDRQINEAVKAAHHAASQVAQALENKKNIAANWESYLTSLKLNTALDPATVQHIFTRVDAIRQEIKKFCELEERLNTLETSRTKYINLMESIPELKNNARNFGLETLMSLDRFFEAVKIELKRKQQRDLATQVMEEKRRARVLMETLLKEAQNVSNQITEQESQALKNWQTWLTDNGFSYTLSPDTAFEALRIVEKLIHLINEKEQTIKVIKECKTFVDEYNELAVSTLRSVGMEEPDKE